MVLNYIWISFFIIAFIVAVYKTINGDVEIFSTIINSTFDLAEASFELSIGLTGILCLWLGIMNIGEQGGAVQLLSKLVGPFFNRLFPEVPEDHPARGAILMNFSANMLGLDNAATPMGLKAMTELQKLNPKKETATNAQIMFLVLNTSGLTLIPITVMNYRALFDAENPSEVFIPILIATFFASIIGLITVAIYQKINLFDKVILAYLGAMTAFVVGMILYFSSLSSEALKVQSSLISNVVLFSIIIMFILMGVQKKINIYNAFIDGAKGGFDIAIKIIPFLVAIIVSIGVFRASGAMDILIEVLEYLFGFVFENVEFVKGLPTAFMKPLSGAGARGMMLESFDHYGVDSFVGKLTATLQGATDTTFYIIAVYFGSVKIRNTRYAIKAGLIADFAGIVAGIIIAYIFFSGSNNSLTQVEVVTQYTEHWSNNLVSQSSLLLKDELEVYNNTYDTLARSKKEYIVRLEKDSISEVKREIVLLEEITINETKKVLVKIKDPKNIKETNNYLMKAINGKIKSIEYLNTSFDK